MTPTLAKSNASLVESGEFELTPRDFAAITGILMQEAGIALSKLEEEFWASKSGQKLIRDRHGEHVRRDERDAPGGRSRQRSHDRSDQRREHE